MQRIALEILSATQLKIQGICEESSETLKILESVKDKALNVARGSKVNSICPGGGYKFYNLEDASDEEIMGPCGGYYGNITILAA